MRIADALVALNGPSGSASTLTGMLDTFLSLVIVAAAVLPGFIAAELTQRGRAVAVGDSQSTLLHALFYAVLINLVWSWRTWQLAQNLTGGNWQHHLAELVVWVILVLLVSPVVLGLTINAVLRKAEQKGTLSWWHYALGGRDSRDAWDYSFQRAAANGAWVLVHLKGGDPDYPRMVLGKYGQHSAVGQTPAAHDLFLQELWSVDVDGNPVAPIEPSRSMWVAIAEIAEIYFLN
jgi:hypothetical protein